MKFVSPLNKFGLAVSFARYCNVSVRNVGETSSGERHGELVFGMDTLSEVQMKPLKLFFALPCLDIFLVL